MTEVNTQQPRELKKELSFLDLIIIGVVGAVGTGILFSAAAMTGIAGPGSWLGWLLGGVFYLFIGLTFAELVTTYPEAGGPSRYVLYTHGWFTNTINSLADLIWYIFIPPIEAFAVVDGLSIFNPSLVTASGAPTLMGGVIAAVLMVFMVPFNYFGIKVFGKSTVAFGIVKLFFYIAVGIGLAALVYKGANLTSYGGFLPFGFSGVFLAIPFAMFAFGGIRVLPDYAEESKKFRKLPLAIIIVVIGQLLIYLFLDWIFVTGIDWGRLGISPGNWAGVGAIAGNPFITIAHSYNSTLILAFTIVIGIIGPFIVGYVYLGGGSRVLLAQGRTKIMPNLMKFIHQKYSVPYWALLALALIGGILAFVSAPIPSIYGLIEDAVVAGYLGFAVNPVALVVSRRQGATKYRIPGGTIIAPIAFVAASLIIFWSGWTTVYYAVAILTVGVVIFGLILPVVRNTTKRDLKHFRNSLWYIGYIAFMLSMTYIGSDGAQSILTFYEATAVVVVVSVLVFFPLGVFSGLKNKLEEADYAASTELDREEPVVLT
ncbi:MAG: APC family permease [Candidatus Thermoplasmatota archaeon]|jgi:amino acid transporter|nr:APC family permease [Candidatus Thermoplasmatota archaeon]MCL5955189.1 APC family permease [Candidatus Thermoplasmatota archaeon]